MGSKPREESWLRVSQDELLEGEKLILSKNANAVIKRSDYDLNELTPGIDFLLRYFGMNGTEAIGGRLHLTNYRLIFKSHPVNRVTGKFSVFLTTIKDVEDTSVFVSKKIAISTQTQRFEFVVWGIPQLIAAIESAKNNIDSTLQKFIANEAASNYVKCGSGFEKFKASEVAKLTLDILLPMVKMLATGQNPLDITNYISVSNILNLIELLKGF